MDKAMAEVALRPDLTLAHGDKKSAVRIKNEVMSKVCSKGRCLQRPR